MRTADLSRREVWFSAGGRRGDSLQCAAPSWPLVSPRARAPPPAAEALVQGGCKAAGSGRVEHHKGVEGIYSQTVVSGLE